MHTYTHMDVQTCIVHAYLNSVNICIVVLKVLNIMDRDVNIIVCCVSYLERV